MLNPIFYVAAKSFRDMKRKLLIVVLCFIIVKINLAQEKFAVLITGDYAAAGIPAEEQWTQGLGKSVYGYEEFWYDTYLMWEMLVFEKGFSDENVFVLFAGGSDFYFDEMSARYNAEISHYDYYPITDFEASIENVETVFNGLANGTEGFQQMTEDDFLFVWTFDHGGPAPGSGPVYLQLMDGNMTVFEFANLVNPIVANKKVYWMQQCRSGSFASLLEAENTVFHSACQPNERALPADNKDVEGNEITEWDNYYGYGNYYRHGEFDFHLYGAMVGVSPAGVDHYSGQPYSEADENSDNYISVLESYNWEDTHESIDDQMNQGEDPLYSDLGSIGANTALDYPTLLFSDIDEDDNIVNYRGLIGISKDIHVTSGNQLVFNSNADIELLNEAKLIVDEGAILSLENDVKIISTNSDNKLILNGDLICGENVQFNSSSGEYFNITINNNNSNIEVSSVLFNVCEISNYRVGLSMDNCNFTNSNINSYQGSISLTNSTFENTYSYLYNTFEDFPFSINIANCEFINGVVGLDIWNYDEFEISNNVFNNLFNGVQLSDCGEGKGDRNINNNSISDNSSSGIIVYNSSASIFNNHIKNNKYGIKLHNNCNVSIYGNIDAQSLSETQTIKDNDSYEIYASQNSFPFYFRYNGIIDENNTGGELDPLVYHHQGVGGFSLKDVRYNCWGNNFSAAEDLYPNGYIWNPIWCPPEIGESESEDEQLFNTAMNYVDQGDFIDAKNSFQLLIGQYPSSTYADASMKELFNIEKYIGSDYSNLSDFFLTNDNIQKDTSLFLLSGFLYNKCNLKIANWESSINWFENIIQNPESIEDSIFAIIDLGYAYLLMENGGYKSSYIGQMTEHKPRSRNDFIEKRDYLLSLIPGDQMSDSHGMGISNLEAGELLQNVPNPFMSETEIWFKLKIDSKVMLKIFSYSGQLIELIDLGLITKGIHSYCLDGTNLNNGIYFCSIFVNGRISDSKKMTVIR